MMKQPGNNGTLTWNPVFAATMSKRFSEAQKFIDSETLRYCSPMVPFVTGALDRSGDLGTVIGSGEVRYAIIYARFQYYRTALTRPYDAQRGGKWFERMKVAHKDDILRGAQKFMGGV